MSQLRCTPPHGFTARKRSVHHWQKPLLCCTTSRTYANVESPPRANLLIANGLPLSTNQTAQVEKASTPVVRSGCNH
jgi:hypothetical protein